MSRYPKIERLEQEYKSFQAMKKDCPDLASEITLFNQQVLTAVGRIHALCLKPGNPYEFTEAGYRAFTTQTFAGMYYADWCKARAVSLAYCLRIYKRLNVGIKIEHCVGETFYAGIPLCSPDEIRQAEDAVSGDYVFEQVSEKIGIDGKYHPVDKYGDFKDYPWDPDDMYGDGTGVTSA